MNLKEFASIPSGSVNWLLLDLNSYFASCEQQSNPRLRGKPIGVVPLFADTTCVLASSVEAKRFGVKTGTSLRDAKKLCPDIEFILAKHKTYVEYHHQIVETVESCLPVDSVLSIDEMVCELTGSQKKIETAIELSHEIKKTLADRVGKYLTVSIGLAPNAFLAKVASDMQKPNGLITLHGENLPDVLYPLKVRDLCGIGYAMEKRLHRFGVFTVQDLYRLSQDEMRFIWGGIVGERYYRWLRGENLRLPRGEQKSLSHQHVLEPEMRTPMKAFFVVKRLLVKAAQRLRDEGFYARRLSLSLKFLKVREFSHDFNETSASTTDYWDGSLRFEETQDTVSLLKFLDLLWAQAGREEKFKASLKPFRVGVILSDFIAEDFHQYSLFENPKRSELNRSMDRINSKYGKDSVTFASIHEVLNAAPARIAFHRVPKLEEF